MERLGAGDFSKGDIRAAFAAQRLQKQPSGHRRVDDKKHKHHAKGDWPGESTARATATSVCEQPRLALDTKARSVPSEQHACVGSLASAGNRTANKDSRVYFKSVAETTYPVEQFAPGGQNTHSDRLLAG
eukprot:Amastigsp_a844334_5.p4 type:complete len:130 gc:universal Amastigsp_a844334_5:1423-1812(+)